MQDIWSTSIAWRHCSACSSTGQYRPTEFKGKSSCTNEEEEREEYFNENWRAIDGKIPFDGHRYSQGQEKGTGPPILVQEEESQSKLGTSLRQDTMGHRTGLHPANIQEVLEVSYPTLRIWYREILECRYIETFRVSKKSTSYRISNIEYLQCWKIVIYFVFFAEYSEISPKFLKNCQIFWKFAENSSKRRSFLRPKYQIDIVSYQEKKPNSVSNEKKRIAQGWSYPWSCPWQCDHLMPILWASPSRGIF